MGFESSSATVASPNVGILPRRAKYRVRFSKSGSLRLVSHHDLMHCFERMLRRASLPLCTTQGFHPQPRMIFAQSLALGIAGLNEVVELELSDILPAEEVQARLIQQAPPGMVFLNTRAIDFKAGAQVRRAFYRLEIPAAEGEKGKKGEGESAPGSPSPLLPSSPSAASFSLASAVEELLRSTEKWVDRTRPRPRRFNLRPYVSQLTFTAPLLEMALWVTPNGAVRPEEVARLLGLDTLLEGRHFFERTFLELYDELPPDDPERLPACLLERVPAEPAPKTDKKVGQAFQPDITERAPRLEDLLLHPALSSEEDG